MTRIRQKLCRHNDLEVVAICHNNEMHRGIYGQTSTIICKCKKCGKKPYYLSIDGIWIELQKTAELMRKMDDE